MGITDTYLKVNKIVDTIEKYVSVVIISAIVLIVFAATLARYVLKDPLFGADRLATYLMVWLGFIGFSIATSKLRHIEIEAVKAKVSNNARYVMNILTSLLASAFLFIMFFLSLKYTQESKLLDDKDIVLGIPLWIIIAVIPVTFILSAIRYAFSSLLWLDILKGRRAEEDVVKKQLL